MHSPTRGYTGTNLELARALMSLGRPNDAIRTLREALGGSSVGEGWYLTRTEVHDGLARGFEAGGSLIARWSITARWPRRGRMETRHIGRGPRPPDASSSVPSSSTVAIVASADDHAAEPLAGRPSASRNRAPRTLCSPR